MTTRIYSSDYDPRGQDGGRPRVITGETETLPERIRPNMPMLTRKSSRTRKLPTHLRDYVLDKFMESTSEKLDRDADEEDISSVRSYRTRSVASVSSRRSIVSNLSDAQYAEMQKFKRKSELEEMRLRLDEDLFLEERRKIDIEIDRKRKIREAERKYQEADLMVNFINGVNVKYEDGPSPTVPLEVNAYAKREERPPITTLSPEAPEFVPLPHPAPPPDIPVCSPQLDMLISSSSLPKPSLPIFESGKDKDFAMLKLAFDNLIDIHPHLHEKYKYHLLIGQLGGGPKKIAESYIRDRMPYTRAMEALDETYGQPRQLIQSELATILNMPNIRYGDDDALDNFYLSVQSLIGMMKSEGDCTELRCGSHVDKLLSKLPSGMRDSFMEYCIKGDLTGNDSAHSYSLIDFNTWLQVKARARRLASHAVQPYRKDCASATFASTTSKTTKFTGRRLPVNGGRKIEQQTVALVTHTDAPTKQDRAAPTSKTATPGQRVFKSFCPCCFGEHYLNSCPEFAKFTPDEVDNWLQDRCCRCGRKHKVQNCTLRKPCKLCKEIHLTVLHESVQRTSSKVLSIGVNSPSVLLDQPCRPISTMLKVVKVTLHGPQHSVDTYAILDDGSQRTMILMTAVDQLQLPRCEDCILLSTIRQDAFRCSGYSVNVTISPQNNPSMQFNIQGAFTADSLGLSEYSYPVNALKQKYHHLRDIDLSDINGATPMILIGSDYPELITPQEPIRKGPMGSPIAVHTKLGWSLQGPANCWSSVESRCLFTSTSGETSSDNELLQNVERLWQMDRLPYEKTMTRSKQDCRAVDLLERKTVCVEVDGMQRYATPLLRKLDCPPFNAKTEAAFKVLVRTEHQLARNVEKVKTHNDLIQKLVDGGLVKIICESDTVSPESWYVPHHVVSNNGKDRLVFNCSFQVGSMNLNKSLLSGPQLGSSLLGVLVRFRQYPVAVYGDIKAMFHQVRLLPEDRPLLRFLWRNMDTTVPPNIYEWQVLPFGTTCSPCCAIYALQHHATREKRNFPNVYTSVMSAYYVDNCLDSVPTVEEAKGLVHQTQQVLDAGGFHMRQWTSNVQEVVSDLPTEDRSSTCELWLTFGESQGRTEGMLGLRWACDTDELSYKVRCIEYKELSMRTIYQVLASQYDPIGYLGPYIARAKVIVQDLWKTHSDWNTPIESVELKEKWFEWERELDDIVSVKLPRCYTPSSVNLADVNRDVHIFTDASERLYGAVAYLRTVGPSGEIYVAFIQSRSRVAPKRQTSIPRLELCAALCGAQLSDVLLTELTFPIHKVVYWTDSTTVLAWLRSESCRYKVFVGTRIAEIQNLTDISSWRYVDTASNPADDITRGKTLRSLCINSRWKNGPSFLQLQTSNWPQEQVCESVEDTELRSTRCLMTVNETVALPDPSKYRSWTDLISDSVSAVTGAASDLNSVDNREKTEHYILHHAQAQDFPSEMKALQKGKVIPAGSRLSQLDPVYDDSIGLIRVGGRLRQSDELPGDVKHPIVLHPSNPVTRLIIRKYDEKLLHFGYERVFAEIRRKYWILRGREAVRKHQRACVMCQKLKASPVVPKMSDLPLSRLRLFKQAFYTTGIDCFGPFSVAIGRRSEKRWGIIYKCLTTRAVYLDLVDSLSADAFLMSLRCFIARRGKPFELCSDCGTNFKAGDKELKESWDAMLPAVQKRLVEQSIKFKFNPPHAPHFGGVWEREIRSVKYGLKAVLGVQRVTESVLRTVMTEVEGILNSKPLGYVSSDVHDVDPVTPNVLLMGRRDAYLPQVVYPESELLGRKRWRHSQVLADQFWLHFIRNYLPSLTVRQKWQADRPGGEPLRCGDVVMIIDSQQVRGSWLTGKVVETFPSRDGRVRSVRVQCGRTSLLRPVAKLIRLPQCEELDI